MDWTYLDSAAFRSRFAVCGRVVFVVDGLQCPGCVHAIESLREVAPGIRDLRLDLSQSLLFVDLEPNAQLELLAKGLEKRGYFIRPLSDELVPKVNRDLTQRMAVAGACAGNIMLLSFALYSGAESSSLARAFHWFIFVMYLPILFYSAVPFFKRGLWGGMHSIDTPIAVSILMGTLLGVYQLLTQQSNVYFDSLAVLIFLLLVGRVILQSVQNRHLRPTQFISFFEGTPIEKQTESKQWKVCDLSSVNYGDVVRYTTGQTVGVDGELLSANTMADESILTGECAPKHRLCGEIILAGSRISGPAALLRVQRVGYQTQLGQLLLEAKQQTQVHTVNKSDRLARIFTPVVLGGGLVVLILFGLFGDWQAGFDRSLALVVLACPCAFALAAPLAQSLALHRAAKLGIYIKDAFALDRIREVRTIYFDKTGTLSTPNLRFRGWFPRAPDESEGQIIATLERHSQHPTARLLRQEVGSVPVIEGVRVEEIAGRGVAARIDGKYWELRQSHESELSSTGLFCDGQERLSASFVSQPRPGVSGLLSNLRSKGYFLKLVSGDKRQPTYDFGAEVGFNDDEILAELSPQQKAESICSDAPALMVGDGINDAICLASAHVSVAVSGSADAALRHAGVYFMREGIDQLNSVIDLSQRLNHIIYRNFGFAIGYNVVGIVLAIGGFVSPLLAAVLMPASSLLMLLSTTVGFRRNKQGQQGALTWPSLVYNHS